VVEHNLELIKCADHLIDLGPEAGDLGGNLVGQGTPEYIAGLDNSQTGKYLQKKLK
jgi:excinuclease ABC subunit A